ncbi:MAG: YigZ family protein [Anaerolineales bacterium]
MIPALRFFEPYPVPAREVRHEITVVNSRFIATIAPVFTVEAARDFIQRIRTAFPDATHNVPAYLVGYGDSVIAHSSDDGEPSGTAGRPALTVLRGSGLGDVAVVVTRYFGGTKLGTGGLVRAYTQAVQEALEHTPRAQKVLAHTLMAAVPYAFYERVRDLTPVYAGQVLDAEFGVEVTLTVRLPVDALEAYQRALQELSGGKLQAEIMETGVAIVPMAA